MTKKLISELGLRYPPNSRQDELGRAALLAMLATDVSHVAPPSLDAAIRRWVQTKAFMPKASELLSLATEHERDAKNRPGSYRMEGETLAQRRNYDLLYAAAEPGKPPMRRDVHWEGDGAGYLVAGAPNWSHCFADRVSKPA